MQPDEGEVVPPSGNAESWASSWSCGFQAQEPHVIQKPSQYPSVKWWYPFSASPKGWPQDPMRPRRGPYGFFRDDLNFTGDPARWVTGESRQARALSVPYLAVIFLGNQVEKKKCSRLVPPTFPSGSDLFKRPRQISFDSPPLPQSFTACQAVISMLAIAQWTEQT